jgi:hypothetical protein
MAWGDLKKPPLRRHRMTGQRSLIPHILRAIIDNGGRIRTKTCIRKVREALRDQLNQYDLEYLDNERPEPRIEQNVRAARKIMVTEDLIEPVSVSGRGCWEITDQGRSRLSSHEHWQFTVDWFRNR